MRPASVDMDVVFCLELYSNSMTYQHTMVVYKLQNEFYRGICQIGIRGEVKPNLEDISDVVLIPTEAYCPLIPPELTEAPANLSKAFVKMPGLSGYMPLQANAIGNSVLREISVLETLRTRPHSNIGEYLGCETRKGRIIGICLVKYCENLEKRLNPGSYGKGIFRCANSKRQLSDRETVSLRSRRRHQTSAFAWPRP